VGLNSIGIEMFLLFQTVPSGKPSGSRIGYQIEWETCMLLFMITQF
jgi:hypothetical protein